MTLFPASRASQAREALSPAERAVTVASYLARANQRGVSETYLPEGSIILTAEEVEQVRLALANYKSPGLQALQVERRKAALALLSGGAGEATPT